MATENYALSVTTTLPYTEALTLVIEELKKEGFGVLTEIDVHDTLKSKLGLDFKPYKILGACNPNLAHKVLEAEHLVGVLMPCNVVIWDEGSHRVVAAMNPEVMSGLIESSTVKEVAQEAAMRLSRVLSHIPK